MSMTFPYCTIDDLQMVFKDIEQFNGQTVVEDFTITSGQTNTYQKEHTGLVGYVTQNDTPLTVRASIALTEANAGSFYYDSTNDILYIHATDSADPDTHTIEIAEKSFSAMFTYFSNVAFERLESMLDPKYPRPLPFAKSATYQGYNYDADIVNAASILTAIEFIRYNDPENGLVEIFEKSLWNPQEESGMLWEYRKGLRAFSFETTKDQFDGNVTMLVHDAASTGLIHLAGVGDRSNRQIIRLKITTGGAVGTAEYQISTDLETSWSGTALTKTQYLYLYNGVYVKFTGTFVADDKWEIYFAGDEEVTGATIRSIQLRRF